MSIAVISPQCSKQSAERLANLLKVPFLGDMFKDKANFTDYDYVINYGVSFPILYNKIINSPEAVGICVNKLSTFKRISKLCKTVEWTKDRDVAYSWFKNDGVVVARSKATGSQGDGLTYCQTEQEFKDAPAKFWTRYFDHEKEVRINVYKNTILTVYDKQIKGDEFEFIPLQITGQHPDVTAMIQAIQQTIGIDLYGLDVIINKYGECRLLEVNSGAILHKETEKILVKLLKEDLK